MPTALVGNRNKPRLRSGVTLIELLVVVMLISLLVGISFPAITSGIETLRLNAAVNNVVSFVNSGLNRAERRQQVVEVTIAKGANSLSLRSSDRTFRKELNMPDGIKIGNVLPELPEAADTNAPRSFLLYPGGVAPAFGVVLVNRKKAERIVRVDPITGVPQVEVPK